MAVLKYSSSLFIRLAQLYYNVEYVKYYFDGYIK